MIEGLASIESHFNSVFSIYSTMVGLSLGEGEDSLRVASCATRICPDKPLISSRYKSTFLYITIPGSVVTCTAYTQPTPPTHNKVLKVKNKK